MKIRCKSCKSRIDAADYSCPVCGNVNFYMDSELRSAYRKHKTRKIVTTLVVIFSVIAVFAIPIGIKTANYYKDQRKVALNNVGYEAANAQCGNNFKAGKVVSSKYGEPFYTFYITYHGEPDSFTADCIVFCNSLCENKAWQQDWYEVKISCNEKVFDYNNERHLVEINYPCEISKFERLELMSLRILTGNWNEEEKRSLRDDSASYPFNLILN